MSTSSLAGWLQRLESLHPTEIELGLGRVAEVGARLGCLDMGCPVITVAGTNGKGSTVATLQVFAKTAGRRVGAFTSPHLLYYNERICIDGTAVSDECITAAFESIEAARGEISLTYFEFGTLAALTIFAAARLDLVILEVGLGGRLDAVNIVDPSVAIITSISLDHQSWLGNSRERIALEKAGILRPGIPVMVADQHPAASLLTRIDELGCGARFVEPELLALIPPGPLRGENIAAAWQAAAALDFAPPLEQLPALVAQLSLPGRLQSLLVDGVSVVLDVAHNEAAVGNLASSLRKRHGKPVCAVFGALSDKDIHAMIRCCSGLFDGWYVANLPANDRALPAAELAAILRGRGEQVRYECNSPEQAFQKALDDLEKGSTLVVFGSFYTVAAVMEHIERVGDSS
jgi:dihydrofolate synthase/folylpolyglutamate synthase